jgi:hypothetical protein
MLIGRDRGAGERRCGDDDNHIGYSRIFQEQGKLESGELAMIATLLQAF